MTRRPHRRAATLVETALVISIALLMLFGVFEYARFLLMQNLIENAAREGARYAVVHTADRTEAQIKAEVTKFLVGLETQLPEYTVTVSAIVLRDGTVENTGKGTPLASWDNAKETDGIVVEVTGKYRPLLPSFLSMPETFSLQAKSVMYSEAN